MTKNQSDWMDDTLSPQQRADALVSALATEQKIAQLHGAMQTLNIAEVSVDSDITMWRHVAEIDEVGIPRFRVTNGPVGVGQGDGTPSPAATAMPMTIGLAAGFDPALARDYGDIIGREAATLGQHVLEAPGVCLHRTPLGGRNFEYLSEDPYLSGVLGTQIAQAVQEHGVIAMGKHYVVNDQECERFRVSVEVDESVLRELYLLPFEMLVTDSGIAALMSSYNRVRGVYATEYRHTLTDILRREWGFDGFVQSDFWSARSAAPSINAGMDLEMPDGKWLNEDNVTAALADTSLEIETVDRALRRRYAQMFRMGQFDRPYAPGEIDAQAHGGVARRIGTQIAVLLKNEHAVLPLDRNAGSIAVIGQATYVDDACLGGGGSSKVIPLYTVPPVAGIHDVLAGLDGSATVTKVTVADDLSNLEDAKNAAQRADVVVLMAGLVATEGSDQADMNMLGDQNRLIAEIGPVNPQTVVVLKDGNPIQMPWIDAVPAVLETWNQGQEDGHAVADLLFGVTNPSGKLPTTYPRSYDDTPFAAHPERYPGTDEGDGFPTMRYSEGLQIGYRWYQAQQIPPLFPFGHGLSYTTFDLSDATGDAGDQPGSSPVVIRATLTNTGDRAGAEVVQAYLGFPPAAGQPPKRLVGFQKMSLEAGAAAPVEIVIAPDATNHPLSVWSADEHRFGCPPGEYTVYLGASSEAPSVDTFTVAG